MELQKKNNWRGCYRDVRHGATKSSTGSAEDGGELFPLGRGAASPGRQHLFKIARLSAQIIDQLSFIGCRSLANNVGYPTPSSKSPSRRRRRPCRRQRPTAWCLLLPVFRGRRLWRHRVTWPPGSQPPSPGFCGLWEAALVTSQSHVTARQPTAVVWFLWILGGGACDVTEPRDRPGSQPLSSGFCGFWGRRLWRHRVTWLTPWFWLVGGGDVREHVTSELTGAACCPHLRNWKWKCQSNYRFKWNAIKLITLNGNRLQCIW